MRLQRAQAPVETVGRDAGRTAVAAGSGSRRGGVGESEGRVRDEVMPPLVHAVSGRLSVSSGFTGQAFATAEAAFDGGDGMAVPSGP